MVFVTSLFDQNNSTPNKYFRLIIFRNNDKYGSKNYNKVIILSEKYSFKNCSTNVRKHIRYLSYVLKSVPETKNKLGFLEWWDNSRLPLQYLIWSLEMGESDLNILDWASWYGNINVLNGLKNLGLTSLFKLKYSYIALDMASENGHINVLKWWKNSGLELKYSKDALNCASEYAKINVLEWWKNSGLKLKYDADYVMGNKNFSFRHLPSRSKLWWKSSGLIINYHS